MKKFIFVLAIFVFVIVPLYSFAGGPYVNTVNIDSIEQTTTVIKVVVSHTDPEKFQNVELLVANDKQNEQLAILLTAMAMNKTIKMVSYSGPNRIVSVQIIN